MWEGHTSDQGRRHPDGEEWLRAYEDLFHDAPFLLSILDADWTVRFCTRSVERVLGRPPDAVVDRPLTDWVHPDDRSILERLLRHVVGRPGDRERSVLRFENAAGDWISLELSVLNLLTDPRFDGLVVSAHDVSASVTIAERAAETERKFRAVFDHAFDAMVLTDDAGRYVAVNAAAAELFGAGSADDLLGRSIAEFAAGDFPFEDTWAAFLDTGHQRGEFTLSRPDGRRVVTEFAATANVLPGLHLSIIRDVTARKSRERELLVANSALAEAKIGITVAEGRGLDAPITFANAEFQSLTGYSMDDIRGQSVRLLFGDGTRETDLERLESAGQSSEPVSIEALAYRSDGSEFWCHLDATPVSTDGDGTTVTFYRDVTADTLYRGALRGLHETTRRFLAPDVNRDVPSLAVASMPDVLSLPYGVFFSYEPENDRLAPGPCTDAACPETAIPDVPVSDGILGEVFVTGWGRYVTDLSARPDFDLELPVETALVLPVGRHGLLLAGREDGDITDYQRDLARLFAANLEVGLDRAEQVRLLEASERELAAQRDELERLAGINETIRDVNRALIAVGGSPEGIEHAACRRLADADATMFTWFGSLDDIEQRVVPSSWAGVSATYIDQFVSRLESHPIHSLAVEAIQSNRVAVAESIHGLAGWEAVRPEALRHGFQSVAAIPVRKGTTVVGVIVLGDSRPEPFDTRVRTVYAELGEIIGAALIRATQESDSLTDRSVQIQVAVSGEEFLMNRLSSDLGCSIELEGVLSHRDQRVVMFLDVSGASTERLVERFETQEAIESVRVVSESDESILLEVVLNSVPAQELLAERGGRLQSFLTSDGKTTMWLEFQGRPDLRAFVESLQTVWPHTDFQSRRERTHSLETPTTLHARLREELTPRQFEALQTAYFGGLYRWPRTATTEQLAPAMSITSATFQYHLRAAEQKLLDLIFG